MLTYEALIKQAKVKGMPSTKIRGILREYLQILILKELYKGERGKQLYFTGETYLHLVHNLKRFSEDLDFNSLNLTAARFEAIAKNIIVELKRVGIKSKVQVSHWDNILVAKLIFPEVEKQYNVVSKHSKKQGIVIKLEANRLGWKIKVETEVISGFGEIYPCLCSDKATLFADKIDAVTKKRRGRHLYDIMFMLSNRFPIDRRALKKYGIKQDPLEVILSNVKRYSKADLKKQAEKLRPFLFDERDADLLINGHKIIPKLLERYRKS